MATRRKKEKIKVTSSSALRGEDGEIIGDIQETEETLAKNSTKEIKVEELKLIPVRIKANYLPNLLVKLGEFWANSEARKHIRNVGLDINGDVIRDIDFPLTKQTKYVITVHDVKYEVTII